MKIFVLTVQQTWDGDVALDSTAAFTTREKAEKVFNEHVEDIKQWYAERAEKFPDENWHECSEDLFYEIWLAGDYTNNYYAICAKEVELDKEELTF